MDIRAPWFVRLLVVTLVAAAPALVPAVAAQAAAPTTVITAGPDGPVASRTATFRFRSKPKGAAFQCRMDDGAWKRCSSPKTYRKLRQGEHTFRVRARKDGRVDRTPAKRTFSVDTVGPETTITAGPDALSDDRTPTFTFEAPEAASFTCTLDATTYAGCTSPFTAPTDLTDDDHAFTVAGVDALGNPDPSPAEWVFAVDTPLTDDLATAASAASFYAPDAVALDVPATCGTDVPVDCPGGQPLPPADQLSIGVSRDVEAGGQPGVYHVTATLAVTTLTAPIVTIFGSDCTVTVTSAAGSSPTWEAAVALVFEPHGDGPDLQVRPSNVELSGVEAVDYAVQGPMTCDLVDVPPGFVADVARGALMTWFDTIGPLCAAPGPAYLGPCPAE